jgi:hypothetical protein
MTWFTLTDKTIRDLTRNILNLNAKQIWNDTPEDFRPMLSFSSFNSTLGYNGGLPYWLKWHSLGPGQILIYLGSQNLSPDKNLTQCLQNLNSTKTNSSRNYFICGKWSHKTLFSLLFFSKKCISDISRTIGPVGWCVEGMWSEFQMTAVHIPDYYRVISLTLLHWLSY